MPAATLNGKYSGGGGIHMNGRKDNGGGGGLRLASAQATREAFIKVNGTAATKKPTHVPWIDVGDEDDGQRRMGNGKKRKASVGYLGSGVGPVKVKKVKVKKWQEGEGKEEEDEEDGGGYGHRHDHHEFEHGHGYGHDDRDGQDTGGVAAAPSASSSSSSSSSVSLLASASGSTFASSSSGFPSSPTKRKKIRHSPLTNGSVAAAAALEYGRFNGLNGTTTSKTNGINGVHGTTNGVDSKSTTIQEHRKQLPIALGREALIEEIRRNDVTVLLGETGSGKTTQVPQYLLEAGISGQGIIAVTQPRKVAATSLAARVAVEQQSRVGETVGYSVRFDEKSGPQTRIKYLTDGMIVRELLSDPLLSRYSVIIVDEAHERTLRTDLLIANLKKIQKKRNAGGEMGLDANGTAKGKGKAKKGNHLPPLKIVIMSATLDAEKFSKFFDNAKILYVKGRQHPVKIYYSTEGQVDYVDAAMRTFFQIHIDQPPGDVLIFLPGQEDIESLEKSVHLFANQLPKEHQQVLICPMYAAQAAGRNSQVFLSTPSGTRKCILATNIAETSITIPGVKYVIDTGKCKEKRFLARESGGGLDTLMTRDITKSSALQRSGRAGREGVGVCFRLYTEDAFNKMAPSAEPEILRCSLSSSLLQLKCLGQDLEDLDLMDKPDRGGVIAALKTLWILNAIDQKRGLTDIGREMAAFPLEPPQARAVVASKEFGCTFEILEIVSVLSASSKLFLDLSDRRETIADARLKFRHPSGDHMTVLNVVNAYHEMATLSTKNARKDWCRQHFLNERCLAEAKEIRDQLRQTCTRLGIDWSVSCMGGKGPEEGRGGGVEEEEPILRSLTCGLAANSALLRPDGSLKPTQGNSTVKIHPSSSLFEKQVVAIIYDELVYTNQVYARGVSSIPKKFLQTMGMINVGGGEI